MPHSLHRRFSLRDLLSTDASAIVEFAITLPLLVVFVVGIYDFSGAFDQKLKIGQAAQEGAIIAGSQPTTDVESATNANPDSLQAVVAAVFNSLAASAVLPNANTGSCSPSQATVVPPPTGTLTWQYSISGCSTVAPTTDTLAITINRALIVPFTGSTNSVPSAVIGTSVTVTYPYHWRFNSAIQLLFPSATYAAITTITEIATVHNQM